MTILKTIIIYEQFIEPIKFLIVAGDVTRFDGMFVNAVGNDMTLQDEFCNMLYDEESGDSTDLLKSGLDKFPIKEVTDGTAVIVAGFLP